MEGVQIEQLASAANMGEPIILSTSASVQECGEEEAHTIPGTVNGQLEIEIPAGDARQGAIHTIQLQSPGGNTHIVEGLVVSNAGGGADGGDGQETTLFHSGSAGTFILPTSQGCNSLANTTLITSPSGGGACEVITADPNDHHILSGLQVVRVTTGENCETIFLVPATAGSKDGMQSVMVLQSADEISEDHSEATTEIVEEAVELNIPSPKPILTTVKQEMDGSERTIVMGDGTRHYDSSNAPTTLVVVTGDRTNGAVARQGVTSEPVDKKPVLSAVATVNGHASTKGGAASTPVVITPSISDDRPKRKAAIKATATRKAVIASLTSPRKQSHSSPRSPRKQKNAPNATASADAKAGGSQNSKQGTTIQVVQTSGRNTVTLASTPAPFVPANPPPPPPVIQSVQPHRVVVAAGAPIQNTPRSYLLLPEDIVSDSDEDGEGPPIRKCVVCVRRRRFTEGIFEVSRLDEATSTNSKPPLIPNMEMLIKHLNIYINYQTLGRPHELGICTSCLDSLQRWHVFASAIQKRHETVRNTGITQDDSPVNREPFETRLYRNFRKMAKVKEVYNSATHGHLTRRDLNEKDWDFFCDHLFRSSSLKSEKARELERYMMCREKLTHVYCVKCQRLVKNGRKGYIKHMRTQHPTDNVLLPCDICGNHFPDKGGPPNTEEYYTHWISHFYFNSCDDCGKRFPTKRSLSNHKQTAHKNKPLQWTKNCAPGEDRPWKCDQCDASFKMKGALVSHRDVVHFNRKNHVCNMCGEAFKSASSLRGHVRRHEGRRDYKCEVCHKEYYTYSALKGHKVVHQTARDFICGICGKAFKKKKALEEHGTLHTGVKPHRCPICGREIRVKSNLYKHMKIHKKNAELGITSARGRHSASTATAASSSTSTPSFTIATASTSTTTTPPAAKASPGKGNKAKANKNEPKVKYVKVERPLTIKDEPGDFPASFSHTTPTSSATLKMATTSSPMQGATAVDVVLENAEIAGSEHRGPIVVSIVTDGPGGPANILHMNPDQQAQLLNVVTSLANSQGQSVTVAGPSGATFLASPLQAVTSGGGSTSRTTLVATSASGGERTEEQILTVPTTQYYTTQQFFGSLDHLQN